jgi:hypothetical protein
MWFGYRDDSNWYPLSVNRVNEIIEMNKAGNKPANLDVDIVKEREPIATLNSDLERMDKKFQGKTKKKKRKRDNRNKNRKKGDKPSGNQ